MALETIVQTIYALNAISQPDYVSNNYPNLICSIDLNECQWSYSPMDFLRRAASFKHNLNAMNVQPQGAPGCEDFDDKRDVGSLDLLSAEGSVTSEEEEKIESTTAQMKRRGDEISECESGEDEDEGSDDDDEGNESNDSEDTSEQDGCEQTRRGGLT